MKKANLLTSIFITGLIAGTLDILAAIFLLASGNAAGVLKYIASGAFGQSALAAGSEMIAWGLVFHYIIAFGWTAAFFLLYPKLPILRRNKWLNAAAYGAFVWALMNLVVLPLSHTPAPRAFTASSVLINAAILIVCVGLPVALLADRFYQNE